MPVTSHSIDHITCIACGQNIDADQFSINVHRQAHRQAEQQQRTEVYEYFRAKTENAELDLAAAVKQRDRLKAEVKDLRHFLRWLRADIDDIIGTKEGEEED